jgi:hypothetical protein
VTVSSGRTVPGTNDSTMIARIKIHPNAADGLSLTDGAAERVGGDAATSELGLSWELLGEEGACCIASSCLAMDTIQACVAGLLHYHRLILYSEDSFPTHLLTILKLM